MIQMITPSFNQELAKLYLGELMFSQETLTVLHIHRQANFTDEVSHTILTR